MITTNSTRFRSRTAAGGLVVAVLMATLSGCTISSDPSPLASETPVASVSATPAVVPSTTPAATPPTATPAAATSPADPLAALSTWTITGASVGPVTIGMPLADLETATGSTFDRSASPWCTFAPLAAEGPASHVTVLLRNEDAPAVDVVWVHEESRFPGADATTVENAAGLPTFEGGLGVGSTLEEFRATFGDRVMDYTGTYGDTGALLAFDDGAALLTQTPEGVVSRIAVGPVDQITASEFCG